MGIFLGVWGAFVIVSALPAVGVALFQRDRRRRQDALQVLRAVLRTGTALGGIATILVKLHTAGVL
jgi:transcriptional regulator GlxA family with amidase domain